jgi:long-subunit acyl-CoA synthetase (AMP-forming)
VVISYLPLAHVFERILQAAVFLQGASIGFYRGVRTCFFFPPLLIIIVSPPHAITR